MSPDVSSPKRSQSVACRSRTQLLAGLDEHGVLSPILRLVVQHRIEENRSEKYRDILLDIKDHAAIEETSLVNTTCAVSE